MSPLFRSNTLDYIPSLLIVYFELSAGIYAPAGKQKIEVVHDFGFEASNTSKLSGGGQGGGNPGE